MAVAALPPPPTAAKVVSVSPCQSPTWLLATVFQNVADRPPAYVSACLLPFFAFYTQNLGRKIVGISEFFHRYATVCHFCTLSRTELVGVNTLDLYVSFEFSFFG